MLGCCANSKKAQLALSILEEHFGKKCALVAKYLLTHERNTLQDISQYFLKFSPEKLKLSAIKEILLVLLQHQCLLMMRPYTSVVAPSAGSASSSSAATAGEYSTTTVEFSSTGLEYGINLDHILYRLRFSHLIEVCGKYYGDIAINIMEELIHHGRLPIRNILENIMKKLETTGADEYTTQDDVMSVFEKLIQRRFIVPVSTLEIAVIRAEPPIPGTDIFDEIGKAPSNGKKRKSSEPNTSGSVGVENIKKSRSSSTKTSSAVAGPSAADELLPLEIRLMMQKQQQLQLLPQNPNLDHSSNSGGSTSNGTVSKRGGRGGRGRGRGAGSNRRDGDNSSSSLTTSSSTTFTNHPNHNLLSFESDSNLGPRESNLWTIGWEQLDREERHQLCINVAHQRMGSLAGSIVKIILDRSMPTEIGSKQGHSSPMSLLDLCAILRESKSTSGGSGSGGGGGGGGVDIQTIRQVMDLMRCDALGIVDKITGTSPINHYGNGESSSSSGAAGAGATSSSASQNRDHGTQYVINISGICRAVGGRLMRNIAEEKFGKESARIVELLQKHKYLEQQKLSEMLILPAREGRERLYELFKHHWVEYLELSKRGDYNSSSTNFFWNLDQAKLQPQLLEGMYGSILNLRCRKLIEMERGKEILDFRHTITDREEKLKYQKLCLSLNRLDNSIMKVIENTLVLGAW